MIPKIKICGLKHPENIREVLALQPDYIGFIFYPASKRFADQLDASWASQLAGVTKTGVFVNAQVDEVRARIDQYELQAIQLHGDESPAYTTALKDTGVELIKAFGIGDGFDWNRVTEYEDAVDYYLFDTQSARYGGTGVRFDWKLLAGYLSDKPFFLSGGLSTANIPDALRLNDSRLYALDLNSKFETAPGIKDIELLKQTLATIKNE